MRTNQLELPFNVIEDDNQDMCDELFYYICECAMHAAHSRLHDALVAAGYTAIRIEKKATHRVWDIRAALPPDAPAHDHKLLKRQFRKLLKDALLPVKSDEILVMPRGKRVHISFIQIMGHPVVMSHGVAILTPPELAAEYDVD